MAQQTVGMIGLGIMGSAMSANLIRAGFRVAGFDVVPRRRAEHKRAGGVAARSPREVAKRSGIIITSPARISHDSRKRVHGVRITGAMPTASRSTASWHWRCGTNRAWISAAIGSGVGRHDQANNHWACAYLVS